MPQSDLEGMGGIAKVSMCARIPISLPLTTSSWAAPFDRASLPKSCRTTSQRIRQSSKAKFEGCSPSAATEKSQSAPLRKPCDIDNHLAKLTESANVPSKVFNGRITKALIDPENRKRMEDMYPTFAGKPLEDYDLLKRSDCLAFGREILAGIKS